jgi:hypothetical protein
MPAPEGAPGEAHPADDAAGRPDHAADASPPDGPDASSEGRTSDAASWDGTDASDTAKDDGSTADASSWDGARASDAPTDSGSIVEASSWDGAITRTQLKSGVGKALKMPYSTLALNMNYIGLARGLDPNYFHWCVSPIDDDQGKTHLFLSRWPARLGMAGWSTQGELAHYVGNSAEGPFTHVDTVLDNTTVPSSWMVSPHNVRIKKIDDTYVIVYIVQDSRVGNQRGQKIGLLISSSLGGPWTPVGPGGVAVQPSANPSSWAYNGLLGVDNPDIDKVNGKYYIYFKSGPAMNGSMHYGYAESVTLTGTYVISDAPQMDNIDYIEDATAFSWNGYEYLLTTDNFGTNTGIFGAGILWRADAPNSPGPFRMANARIGFGVLSDYTAIPSGATYNYTQWDKFERPAVLMRNGKPAYFYGADSCNVSGAKVTGTYILRCNTDGVGTPI